MAIFDLRCRACRTTSQIVTRGAIKERQKRCGACGSTDVRQSFGSFLRNGPLANPSCGAPARSGFG